MISTNFYLQGLENFNLKSFVGAMKAQYDDLNPCLRQENFTEEVEDLLKRYWDIIPEITFEECLLEPNLEKRRVLFSFLDPSKIFNNTKNKLIDKQTITKKRSFWNDNNVREEKIFKDTYELYSTKIEDIGLKESMMARDCIYTVRCWCTTTQREYWIMVEPSAFDLFKPKDAIEAIASTIRIKEKNPKRIHRQGDVIIVELWGDERDNELHWRNKPLTKDQYLNLLYSET